MISLTYLYSLVSFYTIMIPINILLYPRWFNLLISIGGLISSAILISLKFLNKKKYFENIFMR
jgi:hypothetical protein